MSSSHHSAHLGEGRSVGPVELAASLEAPFAARRLVHDFLAVAERADLEPDAQVVVSELVSNVIVHTACAALLVTVVLTPDTLCVAVEDCDVSPATFRDLSALEETDRGLRLVDALCTRWASEPSELGKTVWAELPVARTHR